MRTVSHVGPVSEGSFLQPSASLSSTSPKNLNFCIPIRQPLQYGLISSLATNKPRERMTRSHPSAELPIIASVKPRPSHNYYAD